MGSTFTTSKAAKIKTTFGQGKFIPFYLQFVPGRVEAVVTSETHPFARSSDGVVYANNVNSIIAFPYYNKIKKRTDIFKNGNYDKYRYFPLLRGMYEVPAKGDPILLCTIGGQNFYLGPLNTEGLPNFNVDHFKNNQVKNSFKDVVYSEGNIETKLFIKEDFSRLQKLLNPKLDSPLQWKIYDQQKKATPDDPTIKPPLISSGLRSCDANCL